jgi:hypothetical protein
MRPNRPFLVGLVCWALIIAGSLGVFSNMKGMTGSAFTDLLHSFPYPPVVAGIILFGSFVGWTVSGICIYEGQGWARYAYMGVSLVYFGQQFLLIFQKMNADEGLNDPHLQSAIHHLELVDGAKIAVILISLVILFLPDAQRYFYPPTYVDE